MTKMHLIAKIMLVVVGIYLLVQLLNNVHVLLISSTGPHVSLGSWPAMLVFLMFVAISCSIVYYLLFRQEKLVRIVAGGEPSRTDVSWLPVAFRLVSVFSGILYMYWVIPTIFSSLQGYLIARQDVLHEGFSTLSPDRILGWVILLALGVYLLCGAPHFVRWQVKKTLEQSARSPRLREEGGESTA